MCNCEAVNHPGSPCGGALCKSAGACHPLEHELGIEPAEEPEITNYADDTPIEDLVWGDGTPVVKQESHLVQHARRELNAINEDPETVEGYLKVIQAFSDMRHSGTSAAHAIGTLALLFSYQNLSPLTDDPEEWMHIAKDVAGQPNLWQNRRNPEAFSTDGGQTYKLNSNPNVIGITISKEN